MKYNEKVRKTGLKIAISMHAPTFVKVNMCLACLKKIQIFNIIQSNSIYAII